MAERNRSQVWLAAACGAALGLAAGIFVSVTTEFPLAPEAGLLLGWAAYRIRRPSHRLTGGMAPGGVEPPHAGSKPAALSTELRGRCRYRG